MFDERIKRMEEEIIALKTCDIKTATRLATIVKEQDISVGLNIPIWHGAPPPPYAFGAKQAIITCTSISGPMICSCHLKNDAGDVGSSYELSGRSVSVWPKKCGNVWEFAVLIYSKNTADAQTVYDGGSVTVNYTLEITATSDFDMEVRYEYYYDGVL